LVSYRGAAVIRHLAAEHRRRGGDTRFGSCRYRGETRQCCERLRGLRAQRLSDRVDGIRAVIDVRSGGQSIDLLEVLAGPGPQCHRNLGTVLGTRLPVAPVDASFGNGRITVVGYIAAENGRVLCDAG
jgi:hypothetical protein